MAIQPSSADRSPFDKWKDGIDAAGRSLAQWNAWDSEIRRTVDEYNRHLSRACWELTRIDDCGGKINHRCE
ncbi:hypothetical protein [Komagataeibacter europaeus]|uniref:hypothetical protein n=1 Tax=Komagataeibacter europaeus TaxID=33995 RepID=UPI000B2215B2|nr:hypothetical protein [Komagataeibacter europaeus]